MSEVRQVITYKTMVYGDDGLFPRYHEVDGVDRYLTGKWSVDCAGKVKAEVCRMESYIKITPHFFKPDEIQKITNEYLHWVDAEDFYTTTEYDCHE